MSIMINNNGVWQENADKSWSQSVPLPLYVGVFRKRYQCECGEKFVLEGGYETHYKRVHTDGKRYKRTSTGLEQL